MTQCTGPSEGYKKAASSGWDIDLSTASCTLNRADESVPHWKMNCVCSRMRMVVSLCSFLSLNSLEWLWRNWESLTMEFQEIQTGMKVSEVQT